MVVIIWMMRMIGWSLKTVDCNFLLTDPKISKSAITQWFLESSFREVLVFWCFKIVRYVKFCVLELFHSRAFAAPFTASTLLYTLRRIQTPQTYIHFTQMLSDTSFRYLGTLQDNNRHQQTPTDTKQHQPTLPNTQKGCSRMCGSLCCHQFSFAGVWWRPLLSYVVFRCQKGV